MAIQYRTVIISLEQQVQGPTLLRFVPALTGVDGEVLLAREYTVTTDVNGQATIALPVPSTASIKYKYYLPRGTGGYSTGSFYLSAGPPISLDSLLLSVLSVPGDPPVVVPGVPVTSMVGITGTKAQFNTALTDGDFVFVGDISDSSIGVSRIVATGVTRVIPNGNSLVVADYFEIQGTGILELQGDAALQVV